MKACDAIWYAASIISSAWFIGVGMLAAIIAVGG